MLKYVGLETTDAIELVFMDQIFIVITKYLTQHELSKWKYFFVGVSRGNRGKKSDQNYSKIIIFKSLYVNNLNLVSESEYMSPRTHLRKTRPMQSPI